MHVPRAQISQLYERLLRAQHPLSPHVLILTALTVDSLCATRILASLLKRDWVQHKIHPVAGYGDLQRAGQELVLPLTRQRGGDGGFVICLGVGGLVDLEETLGLDGVSGEGAERYHHGVEVWVVDARRPWNLQNVFGSGVDDVASGEVPPLVKRPSVEQGRLLTGYDHGGGGVMVWDDGDVADTLDVEKEAWFALQSMPDFDDADIALMEAESDNDDDGVATDGESKKRKSRANSDDEDDSDPDERPRQRLRSNSGTPLPSSPGGNLRSRQQNSTPSGSLPDSLQQPVPSSPPRETSQRQLRRQLLKLRRRHQQTLQKYYDLGTSYAEPVSCMLYSLASDLGREDNDMLWLAIVGISSLQLSPFSQPAKNTSSGARRGPDRQEQIHEVLRDEVRRLNPIPDADLSRSHGQDDAIPTHARSPTDTSIRLSPEPRFLLIRHWSLYDSMLHSPYLSTRLHVWSDAGRRRLHKLLAKMGVSLQEAGKGYVHMDMALKQSLRRKLMQFAPQYNLDGLVPGTDGRSGKEGWGFVRSWGWKATLSAVDVATIVGAILEVGLDSHVVKNVQLDPTGRGSSSFSSRVRALPTPPHSDDDNVDLHGDRPDEPDWVTNRFFAAYDALNPTTTSRRQGLCLLTSHIPTAQLLHRAILRTGSALISKKQIRHLRAFRMGVVKEGPDVPLFTHPGALVKLAGWVSEAVAVLEAEKGRRQPEALVLGCLDETRGVYVVVGLGGGGMGKRVQSKQQIRERDERRKRKEAEKSAQRAERARKREERRRLRKERNAANGLIDSEDESDDTESDGSSAESESDSDLDSDEDEYARARRRERGYGLNRFGQAFQEVVEETGARVRIDSFEHSAVEVKKEDLSGFLEALSLKSVVG